MASEKIDYVLDANIIMAMLIRGQARYKQLIKLYRFYSADYVFVEIKNHQDTILQKTNFTVEELTSFSTHLFTHLIVLPELIIQPDTWQKATLYCHETDPKDIPYVALSISLNIPLLTRDKPLYTGLRKKGFRNVLLFNDFLALQ